MHQLLESEGWKNEGEIVVPDRMFDEICTPAVGLDEPRTGHAHYEIWSTLDQEWEFEFTIVRNPYDRFLSQARQILTAPGMEDMSTVQFFMVAAYEAIREDGVGVDDNHYRPQVDFIGPETRVYQLEDGLTELVDDLKKKGYVSESAEMPCINVGSDKIKNLIRVPLWLLSPDTHNKFMDFYRDDFVRFGYSHEVPTYGLVVDWDRLRAAATYAEFDNEELSCIPDIVVATTR